MGEGGGGPGNLKRAWATATALRRRSYSRFKPPSCNSPHTLSPSLSLFKKVLSNFPATSWPTLSLIEIADADHINCQIFSIHDRARPRSIDQNPPPPPPAACLGAHTLPHPLLFFLLLVKRIIALYAACVIEINTSVLHRTK